MSTKLSKELKNNKYTIIVFSIFLGLFIIGWLVFGLVMPKDNDEKYGNRLDDIKEEYGSIEKAEEEIDTECEKIVSNLESKSYVSEVTTDPSGKIINIIVTVKSGTDTKTAKELGPIVLSDLDDTVKKLYDVQLFIKNENENAKDFPIIGYKNSSDKSFVF